jgi:hypothetical protein
MRNSYETDIMDSRDTLYVTGNDGVRFWAGTFVFCCFGSWFATAAMLFIAADDRQMPALARAFAVVAFMAVVWCAAFVRRGVSGIQASNAQFTELVQCVRREQAERRAWIDSIRDGGGGNPSPRSLLEAESKTYDALASIEQGWS